MYAARRRGREGRRQYGLLFDDGIRLNALAAVELRDRTKIISKKSRSIDAIKKV